MQAVQLPLQEWCLVAAAAEYLLPEARSAMHVPILHLRMHPVLQCGVASMSEWRAG